MPKAGITHDITIEDHDETNRRGFMLRVIHGVDAVSHARTPRLYDLVYLAWVSLLRRSCHQS